MDRTIIKRLTDELDDESFVLTAFEPSDCNYTGCDDKADIYALVSSLAADGGVIVYGYSSDRDEWVANWSARHVMRYLLDTISLIKSCWTIHEISDMIRERMNGNKLD